MGRCLAIYMLLLFCLVTVSRGYSKTEDRELAGNTSDFKQVIERVKTLIPLATNRDSVVALLDKADQIAKTAKNVNSSNLILFYRGQNEYFSSDYENAINYFYKAIDNAEMQNDSLLLARLNLNLGMVYDELEDYDEAHSYFLKSIDICTQINDSQTIAKAYQNIAICYQNKQDLAKAIEFNEKANQLAVLRKDTLMIIDVTNNFGTIAYAQKDLVNSLNAYEKALSLYQKINDRKGIAMAYNNIGLVYLDQKKYPKALDYFQKALALATELKMNSFVGDIYSNLTIYYKELKDYKNAFNCYDRFNIIYDSLAGEKKNKMIYQIQAKYKLGQNNRELEELKQKNMTQEDLIDSAQSTQIYLVIITGLVVLLMGVTFYLLYKEKKLASELKNKTRELSEMNASKDKFFSIIAHDLKNPFNVLVSYTSILKTDLDMFTPEQLKQIISDLNKASENGFNLLQNLLLWTRSQTNRIHILKSNFILKKVFTEVKELADLNMLDKEQRMTMDIDPTLMVYADKDMISAVLRNLVFNAIKFSAKGSEIYLRANRAGSEVRVDVIDSGVGIPDENLKRLFTIDKSATTQGTEGEMGTGLGLVLCKEFIEKNDGKIWVESKEGKGSVFSFIIPVGKDEKSEA